MVDVIKSNPPCFGHLYINGVWFGVDLGVDTILKTRAEKRLDYIIKIC